MSFGVVCRSEARGLSWEEVGKSSPFKSAVDAVSKGLELVESLSEGHPNVFPSCGNLLLLERVAYISSMRRELFRKLKASPVAPCFRRLPGPSNSWVCEL